MTPCLLASLCVISGYSTMAFCAAPSKPVVEDPVKRKIAQGEKLWENKEIPRQEVYDFFASAHADHPESAEILWRFARAAYDLSGSIDKSKAEEKKKKMTEALDLINKAVLLDGTCGDAYRWNGTILNGYGEFLSTKEQIANSYSIKQFWEKALELNPQDKTAMHLIGRWCAELAGLNWVKRQLASALFGSPPKSSFEEALQWFSRAEDLEPGFWKMNRAQIARCYVMIGDKVNAKKWLDLTDEMPNGKSSDDSDATKLSADLRKQI
jgi:tetratricopeptide (TPR) repeat protein